MFMDDGIFATINEDADCPADYVSSSYYRQDYYSYSLSKKDWWKEQVNDTIVPSFLTNLDLQKAINNKKYPLTHPFLQKISKKDRISSFERKALWYSICRDILHKDCGETLLFHLFPQYFNVNKVFGEMVYYAIKLVGRQKANKLNYIELCCSDIRDSIDDEECPF